MVGDYDLRPIPLLLEQLSLICSNMLLIIDLQSFKYIDLGVQVYL
jgi:hypothetical protein